MRSSISSSKPPAMFYAKVLVVICATFIAGLEILSVYLVKHHSFTYARISRQYSEAIKVRPSRPGEPTSVLLVGNSLLLYGVDLDRLNELTSGRIRIYPIFLEATGYYDWLYGLRRLFRQGARPQVVVVGLPVDLFLGSGLRQDYSPLVFFDARDILGVASDLRLDNTATSNLLLGHSSTFWDRRSAIRAEVLHRIVPHFKDLSSLMKTVPTIPQGPEFQAVATSRLQTLNELCEENGAKLIILVPPTPSSESAIRQMAITSQKAGVQTFVPIASAAAVTVQVFTITKSAAAASGTALQPRSSNWRSRAAPSAWVARQPNC
jgi:hypothetical protein